MENGKLVGMEIAFDPDKDRSNVVKHAIKHDR